MTIRRTTFPTSVVLPYFVPSRFHEELRKMLSAGGNNEGNLNYRQELSSRCQLYEDRGAEVARGNVFIGDRLPRERIQNREGRSMM